MVKGEHGRPPRSGWAPLAPELLVDDLDRSRDFWISLLGFDVAYERSDQGFVYLERPEGAQIMLFARSGDWVSGPVDKPLGNGVMLQIIVADFDAVLKRLQTRKTQLLSGPHEVWRRWGDRLGGAGR